MLEESINKIKAGLSVLTPKEQKVIQMRFGIDADKPHTLAEIGMKFGLTRARIKQIEEKALEKIRQLENSIKES